jgi:hypothetical protein
MGISGLLPVLKSISRPKHVSAYRGKAVAIDGYSWLHKGAYACSRELVEGTYTDKCGALAGAASAGSARQIVREHTNLQPATAPRAF